MKSLFQVLRAFVDIIKYPFKLWAWCMDLERPFYIVFPTLMFTACCASGCIYVLIDHFSHTNKTADTAFNSVIKECEASGGLYINTITTKGDRQPHFLCVSIEGTKLTTIGK